MPAPAITGLRQPNLRTLDIPEPFDIPGLDLAAIPGVPQRALPRLRYSSPSGMSPRMQAIYSNDDVYRGLVDAIEHGKAMGGADWTNSVALRGLLRNDLGPEAGDEAFRQLMGFVAASSPMTNAMQNARIATYLYSRARSGLPLPEVGERLQYPYGSPANKTHELLAKSTISGNWYPLNRPKTSSYYENLIGNYEPATIDRHIIRLVSTLHGDPNFLTRIQPEDYWALEELIGRAGREVGLLPGEAAQAARIGGADVTGLRLNNGSRSLLYSFANRFTPTAQKLQLSEDEVRDKMLRGDISLYGLTAMPFAAGALGAGLPAPPPGGPYSPEAN